MAKRNTVTEQSGPLAAMMEQLASTPGDSPVASDPVEQAETKPDSDSTAVLVEIPIAELPPSEFTIHVDIKLTPPQSTIARRIAAQLDRKLVCLRNGQRVTTPSGAIKWMLEQIEKELS